MSFISPADVAGLYPSATDPATIARWIEKAEIRLDQAVRSRTGLPLSGLALSQPDLAPMIRDVLENAVIRVLRNPEGIRQETEGSYSYTVNPMDSSGNIWFPDADLDRLCPRPSRVGSITLKPRGWL